MQEAKSFWFSSLFSEKHGLFSANGSGLSRNKRFRLGNGQSLHEPAEFLQGKLLQIPLASRPLESFFRQALVQQNVSRSIPIQRLDPICPTSTEQIQRRLIHFLAELGLHQRCQTIYLLAHVRISAGDIVILYAAEIKHGRLLSRTPRESRYPCLTETRLPHHAPESRFPRRRVGAIRSQPPVFPVLL